MMMALGVATAALTAQAIGAGKLDQAHRIGMAGLTLGLMGALLTAAVLLIGRLLILAAYTDKAEVAAVAATLLAVLPLFHLFDSMQCINSYLLRAYKIAGAAAAADGGAGRRRPGGRLVVRLRPRQGRTGLAAPDPSPGSPQGAGTMWLMAMAGLALSAALLHYWYRRIVRQAALEAGRAHPSEKEQPRGCSFPAQPESAGRTDPDTRQA